MKSQFQFVFVYHYIILSNMSKYFYSFFLIVI